MGRITETHIAVAIVTMVTMNVGGKTNIQQAVMHGLRNAKLIQN